MRNDPPIAQAVVLCGGIGSRLGALTVDTPKPLLHVAGIAFLERLLFEIRRFGLRRILFLAAHKAETLSVWAAEVCPRLSLDYEIVVEPERAGTGGALVNAKSALDETFFLFNGDSWFDVNLLDLALALDTPDTLAAVALREVDDSARYGTVTLEADRVRAFVEKRGLSEPGLVNGGVYAMRRALVEGLPAQSSLEMDGLAAFAPSGRIAGKRYDGFFLDIGIPEDFARAQTAIPAAQHRSAVFLDRDGVLNADLGYVGTVERFRWLDGAQAAVKRLNDAGWFVFVVTNQAGVARGFYDEASVERLHAYIDRELAQVGAHIDDYRFCPYHPEGIVGAYRRSSEMRKPEAGMLLDLMANWPVDKTRSLMIGDQAHDAEAGRRAGIAAVQLAPEQNLLEIVDAHLGRIAAA